MDALPHEAKISCMRHSKVSISSPFSYERAREGERKKQSFKQLGLRNV